MAQKIGSIVLRTYNEEREEERRLEQEKAGKRRALAGIVATILLVGAVIGGYSFKSVLFPAKQANEMAITPLPTPDAATRALDAQKEGATATAATTASPTAPAMRLATHEDLNSAVHSILYDKIKHYSKQDFTWSRGIPNKADLDAERRKIDQHIEWANALDDPDPRVRTLYLKWLYSYKADLDEAYEELETGAYRAKEKARKEEDDSFDNRNRRSKEVGATLPKP